MKLREFNFNSIRGKALGLCVIDGDKEYCGFVGEVLRQIPHLADRQIKSENLYFDLFVIRLEGEQKISAGREFVHS